MTRRFLIFSTILLLELGALGVFSIMKTTAQDTPKDPYEVILSQYAGTQVFDDLEKYHRKVQSCTVDAAVLALQFYFDAQVLETLTEQGMDVNPFPLDPSCLKLRENMKEELYALQYDICASLTEGDKGKVEGGVCEGLGQSDTDKKRLYSIPFESEEERNKVKKKTLQLRSERAALRAKNRTQYAGDVEVNSQDNPLSLLRFQLLAESEKYLRALTQLANQSIVTRTEQVTTQQTISQLGIATQVNSIQDRFQREKEMLPVVREGVLSWYKELFIYYPQHLQYLLMAKNFDATNMEFDRIARVMQQLRYKLPNSTVDGDKLKSK